MESCGSGLGTDVISKMRENIQEQHLASLTFSLSFSHHSHFSCSLIFLTIESKLLVDTQSISNMFSPHLLQMIVVVGALLFSMDGGKLVSGSIFFKKNSWSNVQARGLGAFAVPSVEVINAKHQVSNQAALHSFLVSQIGSEQQLGEIAANLFEAKSDRSVTLSFWVDSHVGNGIMDLILLEKAGTQVNLTKGRATMPLPTARQTCTESCTKKKKLFKKSKTSCSTNCVAQGYVAEDLQAISGHLMHSLRQHQLLGPMLLAIEQS